MNIQDQLPRDSVEVDPSFGELEGALEVSADSSLDDVLDDSANASFDVIAVSAEITDKIIAEMESMRQSSEHAALKIGELLTQIVQTATTGNREVHESLSEAMGSHADGEDDGAASISDLVLQQVQLVSQFVEKTSAFFKQHLELSSTASQACRTIQKSANEVSELTKTSLVLAINLRIEAARLGDKGNGFATLGQQVQGFSQAVSLAAEQINGSAEEFVDALPRMHQQTLEIEEEMATMSQRFNSEIALVNERTQAMTDSLKATLDQVEYRNNQILGCSNQTLSHLGFQDPLSQGLQRSQHDVKQLDRLVRGEEPDLRSLSQLQDDVGDDGSVYQDAGVVELF